jgi:hypothetical protein
MDTLIINYIEFLEVESEKKDKEYVSMFLEFMDNLNEKIIEAETNFKRSNFSFKNFFLMSHIDLLNYLQKNKKLKTWYDDSYQSIISESTFDIPELFVFLKEMIIYFPDGKGKLQLFLNYISNLIHSKYYQNNDTKPYDIMTKNQELLTEKQIKTKRTKLAKKKQQNERRYIQQTVQMKQQNK